MIRSSIETEDCSKNGSFFPAKAEKEAYCFRKWHYDTIIPARLTTQCRRPGRRPELLNADKILEKERLFDQWLGRNEIVFVL